MTTRRISWLLAMVIAMLAAPFTALAATFNHQQIAYFVPEKRIRVDAGISDPKGVQLARVYFKAGAQADYIFVPMQQSGGRYVATLPAPSASTTSMEYLLLALNKDGQVSRTQAYKVVARRSNETPAWQSASGRGDVKVFTEIPNAPKPVAMYSDSLAMDVVESGARLGAAAGLYAGGSGGAGTAGATAKSAAETGATAKSAAETGATTKSAAETGATTKSAADAGTTPSSGADTGTTAASASAAGGVSTAAIIGGVAIAGVAAAAAGGGGGGGGSSPSGGGGAGGGGGGGGGTTSGITGSWNGRFELRSPGVIAPICIILWNGSISSSNQFDFSVSYGPCGSNQTTRWSGTVGSNGIAQIPIVQMSGGNINYFCPAFPATFQASGSTGTVTAPLVNCTASVSGSVSQLDGVFTGSHP